MGKTKTKSGPKPVPLEERFWRYVSPCPNTGCWWWIGSAIKGYGNIGRGGRGSGSITASRLSYRMHNGMDPGSLFVCHRCDNRLCVNPDHLFLGTNLDNMRDCASKGRARGPGPEIRGERHGGAKLTSDAVAHIRSSREKGVDLARKYGVTPTAICEVRKGRCWKHISTEKVHA